MYVFAKAYRAVIVCGMFVVWPFLELLRMMSCGPQQQFVGASKGAAALA
jgi:hypothetical protein